MLVKKITHKPRGGDKCFTSQEDYKPILGIEGHYKNNPLPATEDAALLMTHLLLKTNLREDELNALLEYAKTSSKGPSAKWITKFYLAPKPQETTLSNETTKLSSAPQAKEETIITQPNPTPETKKIQPDLQTQPTTSKWERAGYALFYTAGTVSLALIVGCCCLLAYDLTRTIIYPSLATPAKMVAVTNTTTPLSLPLNRTLPTPPLKGAGLPAF